MNCRRFTPQAVRRNGNIAGDGATLESDPLHPHEENGELEDTLWRGLRGDPLTNPGNGGQAQFGRHQPVSNPTLERG